MHSRVWGQLSWLTVISVGHFSVILNYNDGWVSYPLGQHREYFNKQHLYLPSKFLKFDSITTVGVGEAKRKPQKQRVAYKNERK